MSSKIELPPERYNELLKAERALTDLATEFDAAEECGIECQELRTIQAEYLNRISAIKKNYAPKKFQPVE